MVTVDYDYSEFNPEGPNYPKEGDYTFSVSSVETGQTRDGHNKLDVHFSCDGGTFRISYNVGHPNDLARKIAFEEIGRLYFACTGQKPGASGVNTDSLINKNFSGSFVLKTGKDGIERPAIYKIKPLDNVAATEAQNKTAGTSSAPWS